METGERLADPPRRALKLRDVPGPFLTHGQRDRVLEMRPADLHDVLPQSRLGLHSLREGLDPGQQVLVYLEDGRDVHRSGEGVVRGLGHVDVIVGVNRGLRAEPAARHLDRAVRDDLVDVHVGLRARSGLPDVERELAVEATLDDFVRGPDDERGLVPREATSPLVHSGGGLLDVSVGVVDSFGHPVVADGEVLERPLGLRPPETRGSRAAPKPPAARRSPGRHRPGSSESSRGPS